MNAPDKIYIEQFPEGHFSETWHQYDQSTRTIKVHEYIHKDALIEWMNKNIKQLNVLYGEIFIARVKDTLKLM